MIPLQRSLRDDLERLGVRRMLLAIHDASFPSDPDEDVGRGSPATRAAGRLFDYARTLGFTGIQLGPQGQTTRGNPSPYDGTIFSRHLGNIALGSLASGGAFDGLVDERALAAARSIEGGPVNHGQAYDAMHAIVEQAYFALQHGARTDLRERLAAFRRAEASWLESDALHAALASVHGGAGHRTWPARERDLWSSGDAALISELLAHHSTAIDRYAFGQLLAHEEHARVRARAGLALYGDLQVGYSDADAWRHAATFVASYRMGAPPSRTNPDGQPWGYPVLDPAQYDGAALALVETRADKAFREYDSLRIDHPHGLVCPWVYRDNTGDVMRAVREGARLFESPDLPDHPRLARFAIARDDQLDRACARYADQWLATLDADQVDRYAVLVDAIAAAAERHGRSRADLTCEVLSTIPLPLACVLRRHGLGRWRVTQKANMDDPHDVYRTENAAREDWVMLGNHDTAPVFAVIRGWAPAHREKWARHLAQRLHLADPSRLARDGFFATAMLAELFASRAENVSIFFADLFGYVDRFNVPGLVDDANWTLRLPADFERLHADRLAREVALDLPLAVELALAA
jgi:4-alpha-glucanotransferase